MATKTAQKSALYQAVTRKYFAPAYLAGALLVLFLTSLFWTVLSARVHLDNADQLADPYLFQSLHVLHLSTFPLAHTFLLKWPIFALVAAFGISAKSLLVATLVCVWVTLAGLVYLLYRIDRRPLVLGTVVLGVALSQLLVPAQPYPGGLLPVNMAMLETRNLEYIVYIGALALLARGPWLRGWRFWAAAGLLAIVFASDRLFLGLSLGGAIIAVVAFALVRSRRLVDVAARWLLASLLALVAASAGLWLLSSALGVTNVSPNAAGTPYGLAIGLKSTIEGSIFAVLGLLTNFGANPVVSATTFRAMPHELVHRLISIAGISYLLNAALVVLALALVIRLAGQIGKKSIKRPSTAFPAAQQLAAMVVCSAGAALALFIATRHDYVVDARYLTIGFFALVIGATAAARTRAWRPERLAITGLVLVLGIVLAIPMALKDHRAELAAQSEVHSRNQQIAQAMATRHTNLLVGDYWRVLPTRIASNNALTVLPLADCTHLRAELTSTAWHPDLATHNFAYLLSFDRGLTDYPHCNLQDIINAYGRPNASLPIAGTIGKPKELLLFYDHGAHPSAVKTRTKNVDASGTVLPVSIDQLTHTTCDGPAIMNIVAHEDDDLLFLNPDLQHDISAGRCIRTVYLTAGDDGRDQFYWLGRQRGAEAAYATMTGSRAVWIHATVKLADREFVTIATMRDNPRISLIFFNLPDGDMHGTGFAASHYASLAKLQAGKRSDIQSVDWQSSYTSEQLTAALVALMHLYQPAEVRTQADVAGTVYPDHSDHLTVSRYAALAHARYEQQQFGGSVVIPFQRYIGYPIHEQPPNVSGADLQAKQAAFFAYANFDGATCRSPNECQSAVYSAYLVRQYAEAP